MNCRYVKLIGGGLFVKAYNFKNCEFIFSVGKSRFFSFPFFLSYSWAFCLSVFANELLGSIARTLSYQFIAFLYLPSKARARPLSNRVKWYDWKISIVDTNYHHLMLSYCWRVKNTGRPLVYLCAFGWNYEGL